MNMETEHITALVDETINSSNGIKRAEPGPLLLSKVRDRISHNERNLAGKFSFGYPFKLVAAFALLAVINASTLLMYLDNTTSNKSDPVKQDINSFIEEYSLRNTIYYY